MDVMLVQQFKEFFVWKRGVPGFEKKTKQSSKVQQLLKQRTDVQALIKVHPQKSLQVESSLIELSTFSVQSVLGMREIAQRT